MVLTFEVCNDCRRNSHEGYNAFSRFEFDAANQCLWCVGDLPSTLRRTKRLAPYQSITPQSCAIAHGVRSRKSVHVGSATLMYLRAVFESFGYLTSTVSESSWENPPLWYMIAGNCGIMLDSNPRPCSPTQRQCHHLPQPQQPLAPPLPPRCPAQDQQASP